MQDISDTRIIIIIQKERTSWVGVPISGSFFAADEAVFYPLSPIDLNIFVSPRDAADQMLFPEAFSAVIFSCGIAQ